MNAGRGPAHVHGHVGLGQANFQTELPESRPCLLRRHGGMGIGRLRSGANAPSLLPGYSLIEA